MKLLLGILNSKLIDFWLRGKGKIQGNVLKLDKDPLLHIPLPNDIQTEQQPIIALVDKILAAKKLDINADTSDLESQIDELVYTLYGLTEEEKNIIRGK